MPMDFGFHAYQPFPITGIPQSAGQIDTKQTDQDRQQQLMLASLLQQQAAGKGPSLAPGQFQQTSDANIQAALAAKAGAAGSPNGQLAANADAGMLGALQNSAAGAAGTTAAGEQFGGSSELGALDTGIRGTDIGLAESQAANNLNIAEANKRNELAQQEIAAKYNLGQNAQQAANSQALWKDLSAILGGAGQAGSSAANMFGSGGGSDGMDFGAGGGGGDAYIPQLAHGGEVQRFDSGGQAQSGVSKFLWSLFNNPSNSASGEPVNFGFTPFNFGNPSQYSAVGSNPGNINQTQSNEDRASQQQLINQLMAQASGNGPSAGQQQLAKSTAQNQRLSQAMGVTNALSGGNQAASLRQAQDQQAVQGQVGAQQEQQLKVSEELAARQQLEQLMNAQRQQDASVATQQAQNQAGWNEAQKRNQIGLQGLESEYNLAQNAQTAKNANSLWGDISSVLSGIGQSLGGLFAAHGGQIPMIDGGTVPGQAKVAGDSPVNDTVDAKLSPGEIVLPRSVTMSAEPAKMAARFVQALRSQRSMRVNA